MIRGNVTENNEALIPIRLRGQNGDEVELRAVLDTGFNRYLTLSPNWIQALKLPFITTVPVRLGNKKMDEADIYQGRILWDGQWEKIEIQDHVSEELPLLGMAMLQGSFVTLRIANGGEVTVEPE